MQNDSDLCKVNGGGISHLNNTCSNVVAIREFVTKTTEKCNIQDSLANALKFFSTILDV